MKFIDEAGWNRTVQNNQDAYGSGVIRFAERWANMMEQEIEKGSKLRDIAERTSHEADTEGITGFMYGCAVNILVHVWVYGEELRRWHNHEYDYDGDGVVNPAILTVRG